VRLHSITKDNIPMVEAAKGKRVEITCRNDRIGEIHKESQRQECNRGRRR
jgi:hypothetical protein